MAPPGFVGVYIARGACAHKLSAALQSGLLFCLVKNAAFYTPSLLLGVLGIVEKPSLTLWQLSY